jgi:hypothetical protein
MNTFFGPESLTGIATAIFRQARRSEKPEFFA